MFTVGDFIVYGANGVCKVTNVSRMACPGMAKKRLYYTMTPCYIRDSSIFSPVDNDRVVMRKVMTKDEAVEFVDRMDEIDELLIQDDKKREQEYKEAVMTCDPHTLVALLKTITHRMQERVQDGKKTTASDMKYSSIAEDNLYGELAVSLEMNKSDVKNYVRCHVQEAISE